MYLLALLTSVTYIQTIAEMRLRQAHSALPAAPSCCCNPSRVELGVSGLRPFVVSCTTCHFELCDGIKWNGMGCDTGAQW